jgi:broad specificity phosphatase PhoE
MVGQPGRGKTFLATKLARYLAFFHQTECRVFQPAVNRRRRLGSFQPASFYDPDNEEAMAQRFKCYEDAMAELKAWLKGGQRRVAIFDASNTSRERRKWVFSELESCVSMPHHVMFVERLVEDPAMIAQIHRDTEANISAGRTSDYKDVPVEQAIADVRQRFANYEKRYEQMEDTSLSWIQSIDGGRGLKANNIRGFLPGRMMQYINSLHPIRRNIYLSRHGQSEYNVLSKIGGDSALSALGREYAAKLGDFAEEVILKDDLHARLWTSTLARTVETGSFIRNTKCADGWVTMRPKRWRALDELYAGTFDGMTYMEIAETAPQEAAARAANKLVYRYPRGESYLDVITRIAPVIYALEQITTPVLIIAHQGILRLIYACVERMRCVCARRLLSAVLPVAVRVGSPRPSLRYACPLHTHRPSARLSQLLQGAAPGGCSVSQHPAPQSAAHYSRRDGRPRGEDIRAAGERRRGRQARSVVLIDDSRIFRSRDEQRPSRDRVLRPHPHPAVRAPPLDARRAS